MIASYPLERSIPMQDNFDLAVAVSDMQAQITAVNGTAH